MFAERKITKIGNSLGVTFPPELLNQLDLHQGDEILMEIEGDKITMKRHHKISLPDGISRDFFEVFQENFQAYRKAIEGLKER